MAARELDSDNSLDNLESRPNVSISQSLPGGHLDVAAVGAA